MLQEKDRIQDLLNQWRQQEAANIVKMAQLVEDNQRIRFELEKAKAASTQEVATGTTQEQTFQKITFDHVDKSERMKINQKNRLENMREMNRMQQKLGPIPPHNFMGNVGGRPPPQMKQPIQVIPHQQPAADSAEKLLAEEDLIDKIDSSRINNLEQRETLSSEIRDGQANKGGSPTSTHPTSTNLDSVLHANDDFTVLAATRAKLHFELADISERDLDQLINSEDDDSSEADIQAGIQRRGPTARDESSHDLTQATRFETLPSSSVWCTGDSRKNR